MNSKLWRISMVLSLAFLLGLSLAVSLGFDAVRVESAQAQGTIYVDDDTCPATGSGSQGDPYCRIQDGVDAGVAGDEILVATGTYTGVQEITAVSGYTYTQVVFLDKSLTLRGGYDVDAWNTAPNPIANPTIIDAQKQGRAVSIVGAYGNQPEVTMEGFTLTGGDYTGLGNPAGVSNRVCAGTGIDCGGGLMAYLATLTLRQMIVSDNVASQNDAGRIGQGGGMYLWELQPGSLIDQTSIISNSIGGSSAYGGGIAIQYGSGLTLSQSTLKDNKAPGSHSAGGGLYVFQPSGLVIITDTNFLNNEAYTAGALDARLTYNGEALQMDRVTMRGNKTDSRGAAMQISKQGSDPSSAHLTNLLLAENEATLSQEYLSVIDIVGGSGATLDMTLAHVTAVNNQTPTFLYVDAYYDDLATVVLTNTLVASFTNAFVGRDNLGVGAVVINHTNTLTNNVTTLHKTLTGSPIFTVVNSLTGDPMLDSNYRLQAGSAAINAGVDAGVTMDIDGEARPYGGGFDIGADERGVYKVYLPLTHSNQ